MGKQVERVKFDQELAKPAWRRWTRKHAKGVLADWRKSGLSMSAYARRSGLNGQRLSWWRKRLGGERGADAGVTFIPGVIEEPASGVVVRLPGGVAIETTNVALVPATWIAAVIRALEGKG